MATEIGRRRLRFDYTRVAPHPRYTAVAVNTHTYTHKHTQDNRVSSTCHESVPPPSPCTIQPTTLRAPDPSPDVASHLLLRREEQVKKIRTPNPRPCSIPWHDVFDCSSRCVRLCVYGSLFRRMVAANVIPLILIFFLPPPPPPTDEILP